MSRKNTGSRADRSVSVGAMDDVIASIDHRGGLTLILKSGAMARILIDASAGVENGMRSFDLVIDRDGVRSILATGDVEEMSDLRRQLSEKLSRSLNGPAAGSKTPWGTIVVGGGVFALAMWLALGPLDVLHIKQGPVAPSQVTATVTAPAPGNGPVAATVTSPPFVMPPIPGLPQMPGPIMTPDQQARLTEALRTANAGNPAAAVPVPPAPASQPGGFATPEAPVSLDDVPTEAPAPAVIAPIPPPPAPVAAPEPPKQVQAPPPDAVTPPSPQPAVAPPAIQRPVTTVTPEAAAPEPPPATPAPDTGANTSSGQDPKEAQALLDKLTVIRTKMQDRTQINEEDLTGLPPAMAQRLRDAGVLRIGRGILGGRPDLPPHAYANAPRDKFGISMIPERNSWAGNNGEIPLPLPGGGDIHTLDDLAGFGIKP